MVYLLDTHLLLWWLADDARLPKKADILLRDPSKAFFVSAASAWEISIKRALGKLEAPPDLENALNASHFALLPIQVRHAVAAGALPPHHQDPFDRMLVAQASLEGLTFLTHDMNLKAYGRFVQVV